jgi:adenylate cyclase, class 2
MPLEIEIKLRLASHELVRQRLVALGAAHHGAVRETNIFFDRPEGSLRAADSGLRVRLTAPLASPPGPGHAEDENPESRSTEALLTFKGPAAATGLRAREAFDLHVRPGEQIVPLLEALGFQQQLLFEKDRDSWRLDDCLVELDTLPVFGCFLEIEGPSEEAVRAVQGQLGLAGLVGERDSYSKMVGEHLRNSEPAASELRFVAQS